MKIIILGDSLSSIKDENKRPETGWGETISEITKLPVLNLAMNGRSTKSFINDLNYPIYLDNVNNDDVVLIQFGHNDQKIEDLSRYTNPNTTYIDNLIHLANIAINKGAKPVILSSVTRFILDTNNPQKINNTNLLDYHNGAQKAALKLGIPFISIYPKSIELFETFGINNLHQVYLHLDKGQSSNYIEGVKDNTHLSNLGAHLIGKLVVNELIKLKIIKIPEQN